MSSFLFGPHRRILNDCRLAGAVLIAPVGNYWWPGFPANVSKDAYSKQLLQDKWAVGVAHYAPWLTYWWNTQNLFPSSSVIVGRIEIFSAADLKVLSKFQGRPHIVRNFFKYLQLP